MKIAIALTCLALVSCTTVRPVTVEPVKPPERVPPAEALVACQKPAKLDDKSFGAVVRKLSETVSLLDQCESKRKELQGFIER